MLARLWTRSDRIEEIAPQPLEPTVAATTAGSLVQSAATTGGLKRRPKPVRICRLYVTEPSEPLVHARALLAFIQEECPNFVGGYVPRPDLERFYRHDLCNLKGWAPHHWTAIARQLGTLTQKKIARERGDRFTAYRIPRGA